MKVFLAEKADTRCCIVKKIDEKMDMLTQEILKKEADNLKVLSYVGEIKGLLVDLFI